MTAANKTAITKPLFQKQHYDAIAKPIGHKIVCVVIDEKDYRIIEAFAEMFADDNPVTFDKVRFRDAVYNAHTKKISNSSSSSAG